MSQHDRIRHVKPWEDDFQDVYPEDIAEGLYLVCGHVEEPNFQEYVRRMIEDRTLDLVAVLGYN